MIHERVLGGESDGSLQMSDRLRQTMSLSAGVDSRERAIRPGQPLVQRRLGRNQRERHLQVSDGQLEMPHGFAGLIGRRQRGPAGCEATVPRRHGRIEVKVATNVERDRIGWVDRERGIGSRQRHRELAGLELDLVSRRHHAQPLLDERRSNERHQERERADADDHDQRGGGPRPDGERTDGNERRLAARAEPCMETHGGNRHTCGAQDANRGNPRGKVEGALKQQRQRRRRRARGDTDPVRVTGPRWLASHSTGRAGSPAHQVREHEVTRGPPHREEHDGAPDQAELDDELQQVIMRVREIDLARTEGGWLVSEEDDFVRTQAHTEGWKRREHRDGGGPLSQSVDVLPARNARHEWLEPDPGRISECRQHERANGHQTPAGESDTSENEEQNPEGEKEAEHGAAAQREHQCQDGEDDAHRGEVAAHDLFSRFALQKVQRRESHARAPASGSDITEPEADEHREPSPEVIRVHEGGGHPTRRRTRLPPDEPRVARHVPEQPTKREDGAEDQE